MATFKQLSYLARVTDAGEIKAPKRMRAEIAATFRGKEIEFLVRRKKNIRTTMQNAYYWGVCIPYVLRGFIDLGNDLNENSADDALTIHEYLKSRFLEPRKVADTNGEMHELPPTTTMLGVAEMMDYIAQVQQFAAEFLNVNIPDPGEQTTLEL